MTHQYPDEGSVRTEGAVVLVHLMQRQTVQPIFNVRGHGFRRMDDWGPYRSARKVARRYVPKVFSRGSHWASLGSVVSVPSVEETMFLNER